MQGNDLGSDFGQRYVVVLEDLLCQRPKPSVLTGLRTWNQKADKWKTNDNMLVWINSFSRRYSISCEVWSFLPEELFDRLIMPIMHVCEDYVAELKRWDSLHDAYIYLRASPQIITVYDSDEDRSSRYWKFRGSVVPSGSTP